ncbi:hypothetical protein [Caulobacter sp. S45]|uniref:hypothetical protein n=1 Tax=Caulobacter sp. S45 TaxID=1641861 RepID=UPI001C20349E|nr:hypothetical protein [Caulobacter sp. S45]
MTLPQLSVVPAVTETPAARANRLMTEARQAASEQITALEEALLTAVHLSAEIAEGGEAYPVGVRDLCRRLAEDVGHRAQTLDALLQHSGSPKRK